MEPSEKDQKILRLIKFKGPLLPVHVVKEIGWNTILVGAALSDLHSKNLIKVSHTKIGGSPVYYVQGQEHKLQNLYKYLHEKEQKAYDLLKQKIVLRDKDQSPVMRVALRNIKDFARPLEVALGENREIFWKWYITSNSEAETTIRKMLEKELPKTKKENIEKQPIKEKELSSQEPINKEEQEKLKDEPREIEEKSPFLNKVKDYFAKNRIEILEQNIIRKTSDAEFIIKVSSSIGGVRYFCKARSKKRFNDSDLSNAYVQGEIKKLPVLFLITGDLTKKAQKLLDEQFKNLTVKRI